MARYRIDSTIVDTTNASDSWPEATDWDGRNHISRATGSEWLHQRLYRSRRGRYYVVHDSAWEGSKAHAEWLSPQEACRWMLLMEHDLPADLQQYEEEIAE